MASSYHNHFRTSIYFSEKSYTNFVSFCPSRFDIHLQASSGNDKISLVFVFHSEVDMKRNFNLDLLRSIAFLMIFVFHFNLMIGTYNIDTPVPLFVRAESWTLGSLGVGIFLMLSGYVLKNSFERSGEKISTFYKKRLLAIFPLFYACYFVAYLWIDLPAGNLLSRYHIWSVFGFDGFLTMRGFSTCYRIGEWYLGVILIYYHLFPFLYKAVKKAPLVFGLSLLVLHFLFMYNYETLAARISDLFKHPILPPEPSASVLVLLPQFVAGIYLAFYVKKCHPALLLACAFIFGVFSFFDLPAGLLPEGTFKGSWIYGNLISVLAVFMIFAYAFSNKKREESKVSRIPLLSGIVGTISKYSFTMFLVHHILQDRLFSKYSDKVVSTGLSAPKYFLLFFFALILTFLLSCLIQNGTDTIMKNLKARFEKRASKGAKANDQASINT